MLVAYIGSVCNTITIITKCKVVDMGRVGVCRGWDKEPRSKEGGRSIGSGHELQFSEVVHIILLCACY